MSESSAPAAVADEPVTPEPVTPEPEPVDPAVDPVDPASTRPVSPSSPPTCSTRSRLHRAVIAGRKAPGPSC